MKTPVHALVPAPSLDLLDGTGTRRRQMLACLEEGFTLSRLVLSPDKSALGAGRLPDYLARARATTRFLGHIRRGTVLAFYPDLVLFHPPAWSKLPALFALSFALRRLRARPGLRVWVDWVDLPRWQSIDLEYPLRLPRPVLRWAERILCESADRITVPSPAMADLLAADLALPRQRFAVLPNSVRRRFLSPEPGFRTPAPGEPIRFLYSGTLDRRRGRSLETLVQSFVDHASDEAEIHLVGTGGAWLRERFTDERVHHVEAGDDAAWVSVARRCHVGLIPYPEKLYFKICLPSKLAFYAACNLRLLASNLPETGRWLSRYGLGTTRPLSQFPEVFAHPRRFLEEVDEKQVDPDWRRALEWEANIEALLYNPAGT